MVYSADVAQQKYEYYLRAKGPKLKIDNDYELKEYVEKSIKEDKKSPEVIAKEIKKMNFKTKMSARTIRNNIYAGYIYNIKSTDMIYNKEYKDKDKNKEKRVCEKVPPEKSIEYRPEEANRREAYGHWEGDLVIGTIYYAHPYRSGERGSNENANRLIRRFIPKGIDITPISEEYIQKIEDWINNYPRAMFNYKSTNEILRELCA